MCIYNNALVNYNVTMFLLIEIKIIFWYKIINNF